MAGVMGLIVVQIQDKIGTKWFISEASLGSRRSPGLE